MTKREGEAMDARDANGILRMDPRYCFLTKGHAGEHEDYLTAWAGSHLPWCGYEMGPKQTDEVTE